MIHIDEDTLLKYALETLDDADEKSKIAAHLVSCQECLAQLEEIYGDLDTIASLRPTAITSRTQESSWTQQWVGSLLRIAALLVVGIALGFGGSFILTKEPHGVSPCYATLSPPADSISLYAVPDATEISSGYD